MSAKQKAEPPFEPKYAPIFYESQEHFGRAKRASNRLLITEHRTAPVLG
jgi:hypothetical protein